MVRANKLGLVVVDASTAMEGNGPAQGPLVKMDLIIAGTDPLATDMVASSVMGFEPGEVPTFAWANKAGMKPEALEDIEVPGEPLDRARRPFVKPHSGHGRVSAASGGLMRFDHLSKRERLDSDESDRASELLLLNDSDLNLRLRKMGKIGCYRVASQRSGTQSDTNADSQ